MNDPHYLLWSGGSVVLSFLAFFVTARRCKHGTALTLVSMVPAVVLGVVCSKLLYMLLQLDFVLAEGVGEHLLSLSPDRFSMVGGILGVCLAVALCGRAVHIGALAALDAFAPAGLLMAALFRFGEYFLACEYMTGTGPYLEESSGLCFFPLAVNCSADPEWAEWYLAVFAIEGVLLLALAAASLVCFRHDRFLRSLFYLCLPQVLLENLLNNVFWWIFCVRVEQAIYMAVMLVILTLFALRARGWRRRLLPIITAALCIGLFVVVEFAMEQKIEFLSFLSVGACYGLMALGTVILLVTEVQVHRSLNVTTP